jgi:hypothetical protein
MISEARREPSRRNGRCSRGPTTSEGKASSSRNAVRHGPSRPQALIPSSQVGGRRTGRLTTIPPNEPDAAQPGVHDLGQTNPSCRRHAGIAPNGLIYTIVG